MDSEKVLGVGRDDVISGYTLSWFRLDMMGQAGAYFRRLAKENAVSEDEARSYSLTNAFSIQSPEFFLAARDLANLPYLTYISLKVKHNDMTLEKARALATPDLEKKIMEAIIELMGYTFEKKENGLPELVFRRETLLQRLTTSYAKKD